MPTPISLDIRRRFAVLIDQGLSARQAARHLMISAATGVRLARLIKTGQSLVPAARKAHYKGILVQFKAFFAEVIAQDPDITMPELCGALYEAHGYQASLSGLSRALKRFGFTYIKRRWSPPNAISQG